MEKIFKKALFLIALVLAVLGQGCKSNKNNPVEPEEGIYYVSLRGNDNNNGSQGQPWRTIQYGIDKMKAGQTLLIEAGVYNEVINIRHSGQPNAIITIKSIENRKVLINGSNLGSTSGITFRSGSSYIKMEGLVVEKFNGWGIFLEGNNNIELKDMEVRNCKNSGVRIDLANSSKIENLYSHNNEGAGLDCIICTSIELINSISVSNKGDTWMDGFAFENQSSEITLENCIADNNDGDGIDSKGNNTIVINSTSKNNAREGIKLWGKNSRIEYCQSLNNGRAGIVLNDGGDFSMENTIVRGNGFKDNDYAMYVGYDEINLTKVKMSHNNIYSNNGAVHFGKLVNISYEDYDNFYNRADCEIYAAFTKRKCYTRNEINNKIWYRETGLGQHSTSIEPTD